MLSVKVKKIYENAVIPNYAKDGDAGFDLHSVEEKILAVGEKDVIKTGIKIEIPEGYFGSIRDRSGLAAKNALHCLAGVVDSGYRGEIGIVMINLGKEEFKINKGDRIAQMLIQMVERVEIEEVEELGESFRGESGFGSTGLKKNQI